eukprot:4917427-Pleurochrysis_carterae.AAC.1
MERLLGMSCAKPSARARAMRASIRDWASAAFRLSLSSVVFDGTMVFAGVGLCSAVSDCRRGSDDEWAEAARVARSADCGQCGVAAALLCSQRQRLISSFGSSALSRVSFSSSTRARSSP